VRDLKSELLFESLSLSACGKAGAADATERGGGIKVAEREHAGEGY